MTKEWEKYKKTIIHLYKVENKRLEDVREIMKNKYGFDAAVRTYREKFKEWGITKYNKNGSPPQPAVVPASPTTEADPSNVWPPPPNGPEPSIPSAGFGGPLHPPLPLLEDNNDSDEESAVPYPDPSASSTTRLAVRPRPNHVQLPPPAQAQGDVQDVAPASDIQQRPDPDQQNEATRYSPHQPEPHPYHLAGSYQDQQQFYPQDGEQRYHGNYFQGQGQPKEGQKDRKNRHKGKGKEKGDHRSNRRQQQPQQFPQAQQFVDHTYIAENQQQAYQGHYGQGQPLQPISPYYTAVPDSHFNTYHNPHLQLAHSQSYDGENNPVQPPYSTQGSGHDGAGAAPPPDYADNNDEQYDNGTGGDGVDDGHGSR